MNWVFWFLVMLAAFMLWCAVSPLFYNIGSSTKNEANAIKEDLNCEKENNDTNIHGIGMKG